MSNLEDFAIASLERTRKNNRKEKPKEGNNDGSGEKNGGGGRRASFLKVVNWLGEQGHQFSTDTFKAVDYIDGERLKEAHTYPLWLKFEIQVGPVSKDLVNSAIDYFLSQNETDSLKKWADDLPEWDGTERLDMMLHTITHCQLTGANAEMGRRWMISGMARIYEPGVKVRAVLVLAQPREAIGKSAFFENLCPNKEWYTDSLPKDLHNKEAYEAVSGKFIAESAEMASMRASSQEALKNYISKGADDYRRPWDRRIGHYPRRCIFGATTNNPNPVPLDGDWSRYWPVLCGEELFNIDYLIENRDQLWAEAKALYKNGEKWWLTDARDLAAVAAARDEMREVSPQADRIAVYIQGKDQISINDMLDFWDTPKAQQNGMAQQVGILLRGYFKMEKRRKRIAGVLQWVYEKTVDTPT